MSKIGTLLTGAGIETVINLQYFPEFIYVGGLNVSILSGASWNIAGKELINIKGQAEVTAYSQFKQQVYTSGPEIAGILTTGEGYLANQQFQLRLTNVGATTPDIFAFSRRRGSGRVVMGSQTVVLAGANQKFANFMALFLDPTNAESFDITFQDARSGARFTDRFEISDIQALFALDNPSNTGTLGLDTLLVLDNSNLVARMGIYIAEATLYTKAAGNVTVTNLGIGAL